MTKHGKSEQVKASAKKTWLNCSGGYSTYAWNIRFREYVLPNTGNASGLVALWGFGIPELECEYNLKPGSWLYGSHDELAEASGLQRNRIGKLLKRLADLNLLEFVSGGGKKQTRLRRIRPQKPGTSEDCPLIINSPQHAIELATKMDPRSFRYGNEEIRPTWRAGKWGQVTSSSPNVQGDSERDRRRRLRAGLQEDRTLAYLDIKAAEPTILMEALERRGLFDRDRWPEDPHKELARVLNKDREQAKKLLNSLPYKKADCVAAIEQWNLPEGSIFLDYAWALDELRKQLWQAGMPNRGKKIRRNVQTLTGAIIYANIGEKRNHKGKVLKWFASGTVAEIINRCCCQVLDAEDSEQIRLLFPIHDAIYISGGHKNCAHEWRNIFTDLCEDLWGIRLSFNLCL